MNDPPSIPDETRPGSVRSARDPAAGDDDRLVVVGCVALPRPVQASVRAGDGADVS